MTPHQTSPTGSPRWPVLATLVSVVLGLHLVLLAGGLTPRLPGTVPTVDAVTATERLAPSDPQRATHELTTQPPPVHVSTVRWITPAPSPAAAPAPQRRKPTRATAMASTDTAVAPPSAEAPSPDVTAPSVDTPHAVHAAASLPTNTEPPASDEPILAATAESNTPATPVELPPAQPPSSTRLQYDVSGTVKGIGYRAQGSLDWIVANGRYDARMEMRVLLLGSRSQTSTGRIDPAGLIPERFADKSRSEKATHFDTEKQRIRFSNNAPDVPLLPGAQDRLSLFMQLASLLQARPEAYAAGQTVDMQVAGTGDAPVWRFEVGEESTILLPAGELRARQLVRQPRKEFDSTVEIWLAPGLEHLPVRLRITQPNGDVADQKLSHMP
ncbi:MAG: DUF3108 domain-containing protein [Hydrogenophaga sp.]|uniref:DUF3108 domain-containing protein n=1 Tax=Hydrogenophaga sp. TaxID=1904254 RepID=UPI002616BAC1|nr:DUF3108 domain-containing protein [Hydrogenophaga sp.]MCV0441157.1 DUF3108 domain-containing protein [Hydrogenophaga sp.]